jgi:S1-C subfamily serine protease
MIRAYSGDQQLGSGSGFLTVIGGKPVVVTVAHVTAGADRFTVAQGGSTQERTARVLGSASCDDLAVLAVNDVSGLEPMLLGSSA